MKLAELIHPWVATSLPDCLIKGLQNDSREICPGDLFFAYPGAAADGRLFMAQACQAGAVAIVYDPIHSQKPFECPTTIPCIPIPHLSKQLAAIASRFYGNPTRGLSVTGVTGTNGKTTIAYLLAQAYDLLGRQAAYIGTLGQGPVQALQSLPNTTPDALCLQRFFHEFQKKGIQRICMEVSSHALSQQRVDHIEFSEAIFTNLSHEHLDYHHTMQAYAEAKAKLFAVPSLRYAIINHDDEYASLMGGQLKKTCQQVTYGLKDGADVRAVAWESTLSGTQLDVVSPWGRHDVRVNLLGGFNAYNALAVFTSLLANGVPSPDVVRVIAQLQPASGRMEVVASSPCVIVDYAHTPDALENVLMTLNQIKRGRLWVVFGCGGDRDRTKRPLMGRIASQYADVAIITSDNPRTEDPMAIVNEVASGISSDTSVEKMVDRKQAIEFALSHVGTDDILLIAGKGHEDYQQIGHARLFFSDQKIVREKLALA